MLLTRPIEDARRTARELAERGHETLLAPLAEIRVSETEEPDFAGVQAVLVTSGNGVRALARSTRRRDIPVFAVGNHTADTARAAGFVHVSSADGDSAALASAVCRSLSPAAGALVHVTSRNGTGELQQALSAAGFECRVVELYDIHVGRTLTEEAIAAFRKNAVDAILVFSPASGKTLVDAIESGGVSAQCDRVVACCISMAAAAKLRDIRFGAIRIAATPTLDAVLALLDDGPVSPHGEPGLKTRS